MALGLRQPFEFAQDFAHLLRFFQRLIRRRTGCDETLSEGCIHLIGPDATTAIEREIPSDPDEPYTQIPNLRQGATVLEDPYENILYDIFSLGSAAKHRVRNSEQKRGIRLDESCKIELRCCFFRGRQRQAVPLE